MSEPSWSERPQETIPLPDDRKLGKWAALAVRATHNWNDGRAFAGTGDIFWPWALLVNKIFSSKGVEPQVRELIFLRVARQLDCPFAWGGNIPMAENAGVTPEQINAIARDDVVHGLGAEPDLIIAATDEVTKTGTLTDATLRALRDRYDDELCRKYILMMSYFNMFCRFNNATRTPLETPGTLVYKVGDRTTPI